jgi:nitroimidazol reductase NimA-like FMN-containing flavoprotein (pyridoxamine 5'-phosphate oxidase superfamily)
MTTERNDEVTAGGTAITYTRRSDQAHYDAQAINSALDEALTCHVGYIDDGLPVVVPVIHSRMGVELILRTSADSQLARVTGVDGGAPLCATVTMLDGLVLPRSEVDHVFNYRSVVARGIGTLITDPTEKRIALDAVVEHLVAGRASHSRPPTDEELATIELITMPLDDVALKGRAGPPVDDEADLALHHWAGVIGIRNDYGPAFPAPDLPYNRAVPAQLANYNRSARAQGYR